MSVIPTRGPFPDPQHLVTRRPVFLILPHQSVPEASGGLSPLPWTGGRRWRGRPLPWPSRTAAQHRRAGRRHPSGLAMAHQLSGAHSDFAWDAWPPHPTHHWALRTSAPDPLRRNKAQQTPREVRVHWPPRRAPRPRVLSRWCPVRRDGPGSAGWAKCLRVPVPLPQRDTVDRPALGNTSSPHSVLC